MRRWARVGTVVATAMVPVAVFAGAAQAATQAAFWPMSSLPLVDSTGHVANGTTTNVTVVSGAYRFNGTSSTATAPNAPVLNPGTSAIRITARVRFDTPPTRTVADYDLVRKGTAGTKGGDWKMEIFPTTYDGVNSPAYCLFQDSTGAKAAVRSKNTRLAGTGWHTITCAKTGSSVSVTVDGTTTSVSARLGSISNTQPVSMGFKPGGGDWYKGDMNQVGISIG